DALAAAYRIVEVPFPRSINNWTAGISDAEFRKPLHESVLERRQTRHHRYDGIAQSLGKFIRSSHHLGQEMSGLDDLLDYWKTFGAIAVEQPLMPAAAQKEIEFPDEIPNIVKPRIHPLPAKWTMNVRRIASDEEPPDAQMRDVPMMDAKVAAPVK